MLPTARGISRSVSQQHRSAPAHHDRRGDPDQHVFIGYRAHGLADGRKRAPLLCANPRRTTGPRTRRSERGPVTRPPVMLTSAVAPPPYALFPRARTYASHRRPYSSSSLFPSSDESALGRRPPVVNTCSVCEHAAYVISASVG